MAERLQLAKKQKNKNDIYDPDCIRYNSPAVYQYTDAQKKQFGLNDEDFASNLKNKYKHILKGKDEEVMDAI